MGISIPSFAFQQMPGASYQAPGYFAGMSESPKPAVSVRRNINGRDMISIEDYDPNDPAHQGLPIRYPNEPVPTISTVNIPRESPMSPYYTNGFTDVNGRGILQQTPENVDPNMVGIDNYFDALRAQNIARQQQMGVYTPPAQSFTPGLFNRPQQYMPAYTQIGDITYDKIFNNPTVNAQQDYFKQLRERYAPSTQQNYVDDKPPYVPTMGYIGKLTVSDPQEYMLEEAKEAAPIQFMVPDPMAQYRNTTGSYSYGNNPYMTQYNPYMSPYGAMPNNYAFYNNGMMQTFKSADEIKKEQQNQLSIMTMMCHLGDKANGTSRTDAEIVEQLTKANKLNAAPVYQPSPTKNLKVCIEVDGEIINKKIIQSNMAPVVIDENRAIALTNYYAAYALPYNVYLVQAVIDHNRMYDEHKAKYPDNMGLVSFLANAGGIYGDMLMQEQYQRTGQIAADLVKMDAFNREMDPVKVEYMKRMYENKQKFGSDYVPPLASVGGRDFYKDTPFGKFDSEKEFTAYSGMSIDPNSGAINVTVPDRLRRLNEQTNYEERRQAFLSTIISQKALASPERRGD